MIATIRRTIAQIVDFAHNLYAQAPAALQTFLTLAVFGLFAAAQGFGWTIPATGTQFNAELAALAGLAYAVVVPLFQTYLLPNLLGWLIDVLRIVPTVKQPPLRTVKANAYGNLPPMVVLWKVA